MAQNLLFRTSPSQSCDNTSLFVSFANPFPSSRAQWERSANAGATWTPNPVASILHPTQASQTERYRTFFRIPAGLTGTYDVSFSGDKQDGTGDPGYLYYDDVFIARTGSTSAATTITLPVTEGLHKLEWRHGIANAGLTSLGVAFNYVNTTLIDECCPTAIYKCGRVNYTPACSFSPVVTQVVPTKATTIMNPSVIANPNGLTIQDLAKTTDGDTSGTSWGGIMVPTNVDATGVVIRYTLPTTFNRVIRVNLWNSGGGGGGGSCWKTFSVSPGDIINYTVGNGGAGNDNQDGNDGTDSRVRHDESGTLLRAYGGRGGGRYRRPPNGVANGGAGGAAGIGGDGGIKGGDGGSPQVTTVQIQSASGGAFGNVAGQTAALAVGGQNAAEISLSNHAFGLGNVALPLKSGNSPRNGNGGNGDFGCGGGGAGAQNTSRNRGGHGGNGIVLIAW